ncbi:MAG: hypothetical protein Q8R02_17035 [Hyphomonadaceae bacterium]|nr:hypothetical protein [Hyphomonadaceae bacterium]
MKTGETWIVTADNLEPIQSLGLSFVVAGQSVVVIPFGAFSTCEEIDPETSEEPHIRKIPAPVAESKPAVTTSRKLGTYIRRLPLTIDTKKLSTETITLLSMLMPEDEWFHLSVAREKFKTAVGGFQPQAYKLFNQTLEQARLQSLVETAEGE